MTTLDDKDLCLKIIGLPNLSRNDISLEYHAGRKLERILGLDRREKIAAKSKMYSKAEIIKKFREHKIGGSLEDTINCVNLLLKKEKIGTTYLLSEKHDGKQFYCIEYRRY